VTTFSSGQKRKKVHHVVFMGNFGDDSNCCYAGAPSLATRRTKIYTPFAGQHERLDDDGPIPSRKTKKTSYCNYLLFCVCDTIWS
jgi:hypothetical protein